MLPIPSFDIAIPALAKSSEQLLKHGLENPSLLTIALVFSGGLLTSLNPCSISLLPITVAYLAGFENKFSALQRSLVFCSGIVSALILLGTLSGLIGNLYGQLPGIIPTLVALLAVGMGLNLLGLVKFPLPEGPDPKAWQEKVPTSLAPLAAGFAFGLASSPCTTPVLAVLLGWIAESGKPIVGIILLASFGFGQVLPLLLAGTAAAAIPRLLAIRPIVRGVPKLSGVFFLFTGLLTLLARWA